jgi:hypothetical protein
MPYLSGDELIRRLAWEDVAVLQAMLVILAVVAMAMLPCIVLLVIFVDDMCAAIARTFRRVRRRRRGVPAGPPLEDLAADLRRLGKARRLPGQTPSRRAVVLAAYDRRLVLACAALGVHEHLADLDGFDKNIERVRMEGALLEAGFLLGGVDTEIDVDGRQDHC